VEKELEVTLGKIHIKDKKYLIDDVLDLPPGIKGSERENIKNKLLANHDLNFAGGFLRHFPDRIYYNPNCTIVPGYEEETYFKYLVHELGHLSHCKIFGRERYNLVDKEFAEGFAVYLAEKLVKSKFNLELPGEDSSREFLAYQFKKDLKKNNINSQTQLKNFLKNNFNFTHFNNPKM